METQTDTKDIEMSQEPENIDNNNNNNLLANMFNSFLSQAEPKVVQNDEEESDDESDDESEEDKSDDKWVALQKLLDSHLRITKCLLRMIKEK